MWNVLDRAIECAPRRKRADVELVQDRPRQRPATPRRIGPRKGPVVDPPSVRRPHGEPVHYGSRARTATGNCSTSLLTATTCLPSSTDPVSRLLHWPPGSSTFVSPQSPPSPTTNLGTRTSSASRTNPSAWPAFAPAACNGV